MAGAAKGRKGWPFKSVYKGMIIIIDHEPLHQIRGKKNMNKLAKFTVLWIDHLDEFLNHH